MSAKLKHKQPNKGFQLELPIPFHIIVVTLSEPSINHLCVGAGGASISMQLYYEKRGADNAFFFSTWSSLSMKYIFTSLGFIDFAIICLKLLPFRVGKNKSQISVKLQVSCNGLSLVLGDKRTDKHTVRKTCPSYWLGL